MTRLRPAQRYPVKFRLPPVLLTPFGLSLVRAHCGHPCGWLAGDNDDQED